jgi:hypothetical protein
LRALPRWAAALLLAATLAALGWSAGTVGPFMAVQDSHRDAVVAQDSYGDIALYGGINARVRAGESYYTAALAEQRAHGYPTRPFVTVRTPVMAYGDRVFGARGWQVIAMLLLGANVLAWMGALGAAGPAERAAAVLLLFASGAGVLYDKIGLVHDLMSGLCLSLALGLYRPHRWWPALLAAAAGLAIRELALPFMLLWGAFAIAQSNGRELRGVAAALALFALGMGLHYLAVHAAQLPGDPASHGWHGMLGPAMVLASIAKLTPLLAVPPAWAGPLALLPLIGWAGLGGRLGLFATAWFSGFALFVALFAQAGNFYWVTLMLPAYMAGLALAPRALWDMGCVALGKTASRKAVLAMGAPLG